MDISSFYFVAYLSNMSSMHKVEPFISNVLKVFHRECLCTVETVFIFIGLFLS